MAIKQCMVCGQEYESCPTCEESRINPWRKTVCCREHFQIRMAFFQWRDGELSDIEVKDMLESLGLTDSSNLRVGYQDFFNKIFASTKEEKIPVVIEYPKKKRRK